MIIGDDCFIGSGAIVVEGVRVRAGAVLGAGVVLTASTVVMDVRGAEAIETRGEIPERAVVIPGYRPKKFPAGSFGVPCALISGTRSESTDRKTSLNDALREYGLNAEEETMGFLTVISETGMCQSSSLFEIGSPALREWPGCHP